MTFKRLHGLAPTLLAVKVRLSSPFDMLLDASSFYPTSAFGKRAFSYSAPRCWNALPRSLHVIPCLDTFKAHLKHHLFTNFSFPHSYMLSILTLDLSLLILQCFIIPFSFFPSSFPVSYLHMSF